MSRLSIWAGEGLAGTGGHRRDGAETGRHPVPAACRARDVPGPAPETCPGPPAPQRDGYREPVAAPSLRVQTVLYENRRAQVDRFLSGLQTAARFALDTGVVGAVSLAVGDCSPDPVVADPAALDWDHDRLGPVGSHAFGANLGFGGGHDRLFATLAEDLVVVVNPDTYPSPRLLAELVAPFADPSVGVVEARQVPLEQPKVHDPATGDTSWASGACFAARADVVTKTGGFDADLFFLYGEDVDFSWRARLAGWRVVHRPSAAIFHDKRLTPAGALEASDLEVSLGAEASVLLAWRWSRPDLAEAILAALDASDEERLRSAAERLHERQRAGTVPEPLDPDHRVGQFVGPDYAVHRFSWGS